MGIVTLILYNQITGIHLINGYISEGALPCKKIRIRRCFLLRAVEQLKSYLNESDMRSAFVQSVGKIMTQKYGDEIEKIVRQNK